MVGVVLIGGIVYIIWSVYDRKIQKRRYYERINTASVNLEAVREKLDKIERPLFELIELQYGEQWAEKISKGAISTGMPSELLVMSWGKPGDIKTSLYRQRKQEKWYYQPYYNRLGNRKYRMEIILENNKIIGWKNLN